MKENRAVKFPLKNGNRFHIPLVNGINRIDRINSFSFSDCENISFSEFPALKPSDIRVNMHNQIKYYNLTAPSIVYDGDGGSNMFSFGDYILLIKWGMCAEDVNDGYSYVKQGEVVWRDFKKGYHYVICDFLYRKSGTLIHDSSAVIYDEYESNIYETDGEVFASPEFCPDISISPDEYTQADTSCIYHFDGEYYFYDEIWHIMKKDKIYQYKRDKYAYDEYIQCWVKLRGYFDCERSACVFSEWINSNKSLLFGRYKKYIVIMPDAIAIELDENGHPADDTYYIDEEECFASVSKSPGTTVKGVRFYKLSSTVYNGNNSYNAYPFMSCAEASSTRLFGVGNGRIYSPKANTLDDFSYDSATQSSTQNAWAVSVANEGTASSKLNAIFSFGQEMIVFSNTNSYKIHSSSGFLRITNLFNKGTFNKKSVTECENKLFFANKEGIFTYNGAVIEQIDKQLGLKGIENCILTSAGKCIYAYIVSDGDSMLYIYQPLYKSWHRINLPYDSYIESDTREIKDIKDMVCMDDRIYILTYASYDTRPGGLDTVNYNTSKLQIYSLSEGKSSHLDFFEEWFFETNMINSYIPGLQRITDVQILCQGSKNNTLKVHLIPNEGTADDTNIIYDGTAADKIGVIRVSLIKTEALFHRIKISGTGDIKIYDVIITTCPGGEKYESDR